MTIMKEDAEKVEFLADEVSQWATYPATARGMVLMVANVIDTIAFDQGPDLIATAIEIAIIQHRMANGDAFANDLKAAIIEKLK